MSKHDPRGQTWSPNHWRRMGRLPWFALACGLLTTPSLAQHASLTVFEPPKGTVSPVAPGDLSHPMFDTTTSVPDRTTAKNSTDMLVAEVEGRKITLGNVKDTIETLPPELGGQDFQILYPRVVEEIMYRTALSIRAREEELDQDPMVQRRIQASADHILANAWLHKHLESGITEAMVLARYDRDIGSRPPPEEVRLRLFLAETDKQARETIAALRAGADFATLARQSSKDPTAANGGDVGFKPWSAVLPEIAGVAQGLMAGELAPVPVRTRFGWVVFRVDERRTGTRPSFAEVRNDLVAAMEQERAKAVAEDVMKAMVIHTFAFNGSERPDLDDPGPSRGDR